MVSPARQATLAFGNTGNLVVSNESPPTSSASPSPPLDPLRRRQVPRSRPSDTHETSANQAGARSVGEDIETDEEDSEPQLSDPEPMLLDDEAEEASDLGSEASELEPEPQPRTEKSKKRRLPFDNDAAGEGRFLDERQKPSRTKQKGKWKEVLLDSDTEDEVQIVAASSKPSTSAPTAASTSQLVPRASASHPLPTASTSTSIRASNPSAKRIPKPVPAHSRPPRARSVFEGVIIEISPQEAARRALARKAAINAAQRKKSGDKLFARTWETTEEEKAIVLGSSDDDVDSGTAARSKGQGEGKGKEKEVTVVYGKKAKTQGKKRPRAASPSSSSSCPSGSSSDPDPLPVPSSLQKKKTKKPTQSKRRKIRGKRVKLSTLSQGVRDRRSADEDERSGDEEFVVGDEEGLVYDTDVEEGEERREGGRAGNPKGKGKKGREELRKRVRNGEDSEEGEEVGRKKGKNKRVAESEDEGRKSGGKGEKRAKASGTKEDMDKKKTKKKKKQVDVTAPDFDIFASENEEDASSEDNIQPSSSKAKVKAVPLKKKEKTKVVEKKTKRSRVRDEEPDDLEILDEQTVFEEKLRKTKDPGARFRELKAARAQRAAATARNKRIVLDSEDEDSATPAPRSRSHSLRPNGSPKRPARQHSYLGAPSSSSSSEDSDEDSEVSSGSDSDTTDIEEFIVSEEDEEAKAEVEKYREGVRAKSQGLKFYLKTYLVYLIHHTVCPEVDWAQDPEFKEARERVTQHLQGLTQNLITSSAWKQEFTHAIMTRPEMDLDPLTAASRGDPCDACTMGKKRHSIYLARLTGRKYDRKTFRDTTWSDDESSASEDYDSGDEPKFSQIKTFEFNLGEACGERAEALHTLHHWQLHTKQLVTDKIAKDRNHFPKAVRTAGMSRDDYKAAQKVVARKKIKEAKRLAERLDDQNVISSLANRLDKEMRDIVNAWAK
ncbi:hypothetical protein JCM11641_007309 [Rhodosporidiobolus odoratus]